jgi:hypothetical protein
MKRLVCLLVFLVATAALAQTPAELKELKPFVGTWSCKGIVYAGDWGPEHPTTSTIDTKWAYGGMWLKTAYSEAKTSKNPKPMTGEGLWGYDAEMKKLVGGWVDSTGAYQTQQSDGWKGDDIVFTGPFHAGGMTMTGRDTFTKKSATEMTHVFDLDMKGTWKKVESDTCWKK